MLEWLKLVPWSSWATFVPLVPAVVFGQSYAARDHDARQAVQVTERLKVEVQALQRQGVALQAKQRRAERRETELVTQVKTLQTAVERSGATGGAAVAPAVRSYGGGSSSRDSDREADERQRQREQKERDYRDCDNRRTACKANCAGMDDTPVGGNYVTKKWQCTSVCNDILCSPP